MMSLDITHIDLESGRLCRSSDDDGFSDSDSDVGSCYSQFYSIADDSSHGDVGESFSASGSRRVSSVAGSDCSVMIENGFGEIKVNLGEVERDCRICHLNLESNGGGGGVAIELGCCCKGDLGAAHKHCAEAWFKIKGNKICEICNSIARNVVNGSDIKSTQQINETNAVATNATSTPVSTPTDTRSCFNGHRFLNFLLACMVFAFVISWLCHFNIPS